MHGVNSLQVMVDKCDFEKTCRLLNMDEGMLAETIEVMFQVFSIEPMHAMSQSL